MDASEIRSKIEAAATKGWPQKEVSVPEWGITLYVRGLSWQQRQEIRAKKDLSGSQSDELLLSMALCDANGERIFPTPDALPKHGPNHLLDQLVAVALQMTVMPPDDAKELEKN